MRVLRPMLIPREISQKLMCGAWMRPLRPGTGPGLTVSKAQRPVWKSLITRPQPRKPGSTSEARGSSGWG